MYSKTNSHGKNYKAFKTALAETAVKALRLELVGGGRDLCCHWLKLN